MSYTTIATTSQTLWRVIESYGLDAAEIFRQAKLDPQRWNDPGARFDEDKLDHAWELATLVCQDPCIGLRVAGHFNPASLQALGFAWLTSDSLYDAFSRTVRYFRAVTSAVELELTLAGDECRLGVGKVFHRRRTHVQSQDALWSALLSLCRLSTSEDFAPLSLHLERPRPPCADKFDALFRAPVFFGSERDQMTLGREQIERPLPTANRTLAIHNDRVVANYLAKLDQNNFADRARARLIETLPSGELDAQALANALHMSLRTMQRRLTEQGTNFTSVLDEARRELAIRYIGELKMPIKEASYVLGFSEPANFTRAFRRWTGQTPSEYRQVG